MIKLEGRSPVNTCFVGFLVHLRWNFSNCTFNWAPLTSCSTPGLQNKCHEGPWRFPAGEWGKIRHVSEAEKISLKHSCFILEHIQQFLQVSKAIQLRSRNCKCACTANICLHSKARNTVDQHFWQVSNSKPVIWLSKSRRAWKMLGYLISKYILANASSWDHLSIETVILLACLILQELPSSSGFQLSFLATTKRCSIWRNSSPGLADLILETFFKGDSHRFPMLINSCNIFYGCLSSDVPRTELCTDLGPWRLCMKLSASDLILKCCEHEQFFSQRNLLNRM